MDTKITTTGTGITTATTATTAQTAATTPLEAAREAVLAGKAWPASVFATRQEARHMRVLSDALERELIRAVAREDGAASGNALQRQLTGIYTYARRNGLMTAPREARGGQVKWLASVLGKYSARRGRAEAISDSGFYRALCALIVTVDATDRAPEYIESEKSAIRADARRILEAESLQRGSAVPASMADTVKAPTPKAAATPAEKPAKKAKKVTEKAETAPKSAAAA
ncbi:MAG: hypothetical protein LBD92_07385 [Oscillospiraceae bacterium]|jgi:hypothetical protein|nr:hypothetical protein [Oscillospiraceae bacterium]